MKEKNNIILVPVDFQKPSLSALTQTYNIARFAKSEILLLYVIESGDFISHLFRSKEDLEKLKAEAQKKLDQLAEDAKAKSELPVKTRVESGKTYEKINEVAKELNTKFIIMGKNGANEGVRKFLGSNTTHVISESECPVISLKGPKKQLGYQNIVLPLDLTRDISKKVTKAIELGSYYRSTIWIVSVLTGGIKMRESRIYSQMQKVKKTIEANKVPCNTKLFKKSDTPVHEVILKYSDQVNADLILIMTHQETNIAGYYIGAFAHHIINESDIPVLSIIPQAKEYTELMVSVVDPLKIIN